MSLFEHFRRTHLDVCVKMRLQYLVSNYAMLPMLDKDDIVEISRQSRVNRGDVICAVIGGRFAMKRVMAIGGDEVRYEGGMVILNGPLTKNAMRQRNLLRDERSPHISGRS